MFNIVLRANDLLHSMPSSYTEILPEFSAKYIVPKDYLPKSDDLIAFIGDCPHRDKITILFSTFSDSAFATDGRDWIDEYQSFKEGLTEDEVNVEICAKKGIVDGMLTVYMLDSFSDFLSGCSVEQLLFNFNDLFNKCGDRITFHLMDVKGYLITKSIAFSDNDVRWEGEWSRMEQLKNCEDASIFLDRNKIRLIPQDFTTIGASEGSGLDRIRQIFSGLRNVLSYIYVANTASVVKEKAILQFDPSAKGYEYELMRLTDNEVVSHVYDWIFKDDGCVDKASIVRKIINVYCRSEESILEIDERVLNSIKSDYIIYQKNHADQYIEMKNKISEFIVDCAKQIQELSHEMVEAIRNNFVAIIVFLMTVLLTDSIDFSQFLDAAVSSNVVAVCWLFTAASVLYLVVTVLTGEQKWKWLEQSYGDLKRNYKGVLDDKDIEEAFVQVNSDGKVSSPLETSRNQYKEFRSKVIIVWIVAIFCMAIFSGILTRNVYDESVVTTERQETISDTKGGSSLDTDRVRDNLEAPNDNQTTVIPASSSD